MKRIIKAALGCLGYEIRKKASDRFTISGISYEVDPCSVRGSLEGEQIAKGAVRLIKGRNLNDLRILDICCGVGIIGLTIFSELRARVTGVGFADINIFNLDSLKRTLKISD
jgi:2-polyprenyl-3-methyl-5-hydroxy-6-metoxy-1,4-benzoquinol methylase